VQSHYALLKEGGMTVDQLRDAGRIAAVIAAAANTIEVEREAIAA
jgi:alkyl hydroperoxide reductase subunit D